MLDWPWWYVVAAHGRRRRVGRGSCRKLRASRGWGPLTTVSDSDRWHEREQKWEFARDKNNLPSWGSLFLGTTDWAYRLCPASARLTSSPDAPAYPTLWPPPPSYQLARADNFTLCKVSGPSITHPEQASLQNLHLAPSAATGHDGAGSGGVRHRSPHRHPRPPPRVPVVE